jgi:Leucine-rich repeat (LRR) protein
MALALAACGSETETAPSGEAEPVIPSDAQLAPLTQHGGTADNPSALGALSQGQSAVAVPTEEPGTSAAVAAVAAAEASVAASSAPTPEPSADPTKELVIPDKTFEQALRAKLDKPEGPILVGEVEALTEFDLTLMLNIVDITGAEHLINLTRFGVSTNDIVDISPLAPLTRLTWLNLAQNEIVDVSPLASLTNLSFLSFEQNQIVDVSPLASLTNLTSLSLRGNQVVDISPLASLTNLTELNLTYNHVSDLSPLSSLSNLKLLTLVNNEITDLSPLLEAGWGEGTEIRLWGEPLDTNSIEVVIPQLEAAGVKVSF